MDGATDLRGVSTRPLPFTVPNRWKGAAPPVPDPAQARDGGGPRLDAMATLIPRRASGTGRSAAPLRRPEGCHTGIPADRSRFAPSAARVLSRSAVRFDFQCPELASSPKPRERRQLATTALFSGDAFAGGARLSAQRVTTPGAPAVHALHRRSDRSSRTSGCGAGATPSAPSHALAGPSWPTGTTAYAARRPPAARQPGPGGAFCRPDRLHSRFSARSGAWPGRHLPTIPTIARASGRPRLHSIACVGARCEIRTAASRPACPVTRLCRTAPRWISTGRALWRCSRTGPDVPGAARTSVRTRRTWTHPRTGALGRSAPRGRLLNARIGCSALPPCVTPRGCSAASAQPLLTRCLQAEGPPRMSVSRPLSTRPRLRTTVNREQSTVTGNGKRPPGTRRRWALNRAAQPVDSRFPCCWPAFV